MDFDDKEDRKKAMAAAAAFFRAKREKEASELEEPPEPLAAVEETPPQASPKVVLTRPRWLADTIRFHEEVLVAADAELPPEAKGRKRVEFTLLAVTPDGDEKIAKKEGFLENGTAQALLPIFRPSYREEGKPLAEVDYWFEARHTLAEPVDTRSTLMRADAIASPIIESHSLPAVAFDFDSSFLSPEQKEELQAMIDRLTYWRDEHPKATIAPFGHADSAGADGYNKSLSERRARSVHAVLIKDVEAYEQLYQQENWGTRKIQLMLKELGIDPGPVDGIQGQKTQAAVRDFQQRDGSLQVDGIAGPKTRAKLFRAYMEALCPLELLPSDFASVGGSPFMGCGERNPLQKDEGPNAVNRRVTLLLCRKADTIPLVFPCRLENLKPCDLQAKKEHTFRTSTFTCPFYDDLLEETGSGDKAARRLRSEMLFDQLHGTAEHLSLADFVMWCHVCFGDDIPSETIETLRKDVLSKTFPQPSIELVTSGELQGHEGGYDKKTRRILVEETLPDRALEDEDESWKLMILLLEEYGHHIDHLLRTHYADEDLSGGDNPMEDEGALFAHAILRLRKYEQAYPVYAEYEREAKRIQLKVDLESIDKAVAEFLSQSHIDSDDEYDEIEFFGAGPGLGAKSHSSSHTHHHQSIEQRAWKGLVTSKPLTNDEMLRIYFGNWERDFSQVIDPKTIIDIQGRSILTRKSLTQIVNVLAEAAFTTPIADVTKVRSGDFKVTQSELGLYRPEEHIDNPKGIDATKKDPDFRGKYDPEEGKIDFTRGMKRYIATEGHSWDTSTAYMEKELKAAVSKGRSRDGFRHLGNALHALEDYYAHSNWTELCLRKLNYDVYPWVTVSQLPPDKIKQAQPPQIDPKVIPGPWAPNAERLPITTGTFGGLDTAASVLVKVGEKFTEKELFTPGKITSTQKIFYILLKEVFPDYADYYAAFVVNMAQFKKDHPFMWEVIHKTLGFIMHLFKFALGVAILFLADAIDQSQSQLGPEGTDPTHTQLAKDPSEHKLHDLAGLCAIEAVRDVGSVIINAWEGKATADAVVKMTRSFIVHPNDTTRLDKIVDDWAKANPAKIKEAKTRSWVTHDVKEMRKLAKEWSGNAKDVIEYLKKLGVL